MTLAVKSGVKPQIRGKATTISFKEFGQSRPVNEPTTSSSQGGCSNHKATAAVIVKIVYGGIENIVGKVENADNQHFLFFLQCF